MKKNLITRLFNSLSLTFSLILCFSFGAFAQLSLDVIVKDAICFETATGSLKAIAKGGTPPYKYSLNNFSFQDEGYFEQLPVGEYRIRVSDSKGESVKKFVNIIQPPKITIGTIAATPTSSCNAKDASLQVRAIGGAPPYTYSLNNGTPRDVGVFENLLGGLYRLTIQDMNGCEFDTSVYLKDDAMEMVIRGEVIQQSDCPMQRKGSFRVIVSNGSPPFRYSIDGGNYQDENIFENLEGNIDYNIFVKDSKGCFNIGRVLLTEPEPFSIEINTKNPNCLSNDGSIQVIASGGTGKLTFSINGKDFQAGSNFSNLPPGNYTLTVRDERGCTVSKNISLDKRIAFKKSAILTHPNCELAKNGKIEVNINGGQAPYQFSIDGFGFQDSNIFTDLLAGQYVISIIDDNGCIDTIKAILVYQNNLKIDVDIKYPNCVPGGGDAADGVLKLNGSGGKPPYRYSIDGVNFVSSNEFEAISALPYTVYVLDENNCFTQKTVYLTPRAKMKVDLKITNTSCAETNDGVVIVSVLEGVAPYNYSLNGQPYQLSNELRGLKPGWNYVNVLDGNGCFDFFPVDISAPTPISVNIFTKPTRCSGTSDGSILIEATGGTQPYTYSLNAPDKPQNTPNFNNLRKGLYFVYVTDAKGCVKMVEAEIIEPRISVISVNPTCEGANGRIDVMVEGGVEPIEYQLNELSPQSSSSFNNLDGGVYNLKVTMGNTCVLTQTIVLREVRQISLRVSIVGVTSCLGKDGEVYVSARGGVPPLLYSMDDKVYQYDSVFRNVPEGKYKVYVRDQNNCKSSLVVDVKLAIENLRLTFLSQNVACNGTQDGYILLNPIGGRPPFSYIWSTGATTKELSNLKAGNYSVTVNDSKDCSATNLITITEPSKLIIEKIVVKNTTNGLPNGSITILASGGTPAYRYGLSGEILQSSNEIRDLAKGRYKIVVVDNSGCITESEAIVDYSVGREDQLSESNIQIYPNPSDGNINLEMNDIMDFTVFIYDLTGKLVYKKNNPAGNHSVSYTSIPLKLDLNPGVYHLLIQTVKGSFAKSIWIK